MNVDLGVNPNKLDLHLHKHIQELNDCEGIQEGNKEKTVISLKKFCL